MEGIDIIVTASAGLNLFILGAVIQNIHRVGKIEGSLKNGGYLRCPFYRGHINKEVGQQNENSKR